MNEERPRQITKAKNSEILIFISHSSKDQVLAEAFVDFLSAALGVSSESIRCTSVDDTDLDPGTHIEKQLKLEVRSAHVFIGLITPNSLKSHYASLEIGGRWVDDEHHLFTVLAGIAASALPSPISTITATVGDNETQLHRLVSTVAEALHLDLRQAQFYNRRLKTFAQLVGQVQGSIADETKTARRNVRQPTAANEQMGSEKSRIHLPQKFDGQFYSDFWESVARTSMARKKTPRDIKVEKLIVLHYIQAGFQIGFRAYKGLSPAKQDVDGLLPLRVYTSSGGPPDSVDFFYWNDRMRLSKVGRVVAKVQSSPAISLNNLNGCRNLCIFQYYFDPDWRPDVFHLNPFPVNKAPLDHYVVVQNTDLAVWNPNKFLLKIDTGHDETETLQISSAVYQTLFPANRTLENARELLSEAEDILSRFLAIPDARSFQPSSSKNNFRLVRKEIMEIFKQGSFRPGVTVYWLRQNANETNLYLAYVFTH